MKRLTLFFLLLPFLLTAQEELDPFSEEALFGNEDPFNEESLFGQTEEEAVQKEEEPVSVLESLEQETRGILWGGKVYSDLQADFTWQDAQADWADRQTWNPQFGADLFIDARPDGDYRVYGKVHFDFDPADSSLDATPGELFADFHYRDRVRFRMGKQMINWSVGYLYSPADILNLEAINPLDPEADREGPLALKTQIPLKGVNLQLYTLFQEMEEPREITWAPKAEFLTGNWEIGTGAVLDPRMTPKGSLFLSGPVGDLDFLGEALLQYGSDSDFYNGRDYGDRLFLSATGGLLYTDGGDRLTLLGQYWYDGVAQSYDNTDIIGHHRGGASLSKGFLLNREAERSSVLTASLLWLGDFTDLSGMVKGGLEWEPLDHGALGVTALYRYGSDLTSYRFLGPGVVAPEFETGVYAKLGYGEF